MLKLSRRAFLKRIAVLAGALGFAKTALPALEPEVPPKAPMPPALRRAVQEGRVGDIEGTWAGVEDVVLPTRGRITQVKIDGKNVPVSGDHFVEAGEAIDVELLARGSVRPYGEHVDLGGFLRRYEGTRIGVYSSWGAPRVVIAGAKDGLE